MFDLTDPSRDQRPYYYDSYAMEAATSQHTCHYRNGFDISVGHTPKVTFHGLQRAAPNARRHFLTFRGTLYFNFHGYEERASIVKLHDPDQGVVVAEKCCGHCFKIWPEELMDVKEDYLQFCAEEMMPRYESFDFQDLMNTTFGLVPGGASPGTHRLAEASTRCRAFSTLAMSSPKASYPHLLSLSLVSLEVNDIDGRNDFHAVTKHKPSTLASLFS
ncbi:unnamed protein product [Ectocarpus fasciculatus]